MPTPAPAPAPTPAPTPVSGASAYPSFIPRNNATGSPDYASVGLTGAAYTPSTGGLPPTKQAPTVYSSNAAANFTNNTMIPAMTAGLGAIQSQNDKNGQNDLTHFLPGETAEQYNARAAKVHASTAPTNATSQPQQQTPEDIAAHQIANTPEAGNQFVYDPTGQRLELPIGSAPPAGYTATPPANPAQRGHTVTNSFNGADGTTYQQFSDGTYGVANADGTFANPVTADDYQKAYDGSPTSILQGIAAGIASLKNGPLPLSAPQQAQIDALNTNLATAVKAQQQANDAFTGGTTVAMNLYGMGNSVSGLGIIKDTVDQGIAKISDLQTKAASAVAQMEESFNKDNLDQMYQYYNAYQTSVKAIDDHIDQMHTFAFQQKEHADQEADNLRTFNETVQQDAVHNQQWGITNAREDKLAASTLATQALDRQKTQLDIDAAKQMNAAATAIGGSTMGTNGTPDPAKQAVFLQTVAKANPGLALQIKAAAEYRLPLTARFFQTKAGQAFTQQMLQYDPTWDATNYAAKQAIVTNFTSGKYSQTINALNTATAHIATLSSAAAALGNKNSPLVNSLYHLIGNNTGLAPNTSGTKLAIAGVTGELAQAFKSSGATDAEIKSLGTINENSSPAAVKSYVEAASSLLAGKLGALNDTYTAGVGSAPPSPLLHPDAQTALSSLKNQGYNIDVPGVIYTDVQAYRKNTPDADSKLDAAKSLLQQNGLPVTPDNVLQAAQINDQ